MARTRSAMRSPSGPSEDSSPMSQVDGSCMAKSSRTETEDESTDAPKLVAPKMPTFLQLTNIETHEKYSELVRLESERLAVAAHGDDSQWARLAPDLSLDRYNNIMPWANNRIKLRVPEGCNDYINASPVTLISTSAKQSKLKSGVQDKYICMQGPKRQTVDHVWHMVWHEVAIPYNSSPAIIIMLSPTHVPAPDNPNKLYEKCYPYYPVDENSPRLQINDSDLGHDFKATVKFVSREPGIEGTDVEVRKLMMTVEVDGEEEEKPIYHYLYPSWPDFGALDEENVASILTLMEISRKQNGKGENPRVVHCSAGVGRTGTFVALEFLIGELQGGAWEGWDDTDHPTPDPVFDTVDQLRQQRKTMVQAYEQYSFLYEVLRKIWEEKYNAPCVGGEHGHGTVDREKLDVCGTGAD